MFDFLSTLTALLAKHDGINDKRKLEQIIIDRFSLSRDRSVYYCEQFALRFSSSRSVNFGNTVLSLSSLQKYDQRPFLVVLVTPSKNVLFIANSTFLRKISHSSHELRENNIRGSFNGTDISRSFEGIANEASSIERLFRIHEGLGFEGNLVRLVEATTNISPTGKKFEIADESSKQIYSAPERAISFTNSADALTLKSELDARVDQFKNEIILASLIENVNVRGRVIEYLIAGKDEELRTELIKALQGNSSGLPSFKTDNELGDYIRLFDEYHTETDVKTKITILNSNPKAYNIDKMLEFLSSEQSVFLFYFIGVDLRTITNTVLVSMFQTDLLKATILLRHWAGRNSRGVTQLEGRTVHKLLVEPSDTIDLERSRLFLKKLTEL